MADIKERIGYRANAKAMASNLLAGKTPIKPSDGFVTVFAERRHNQSSLGEYGGDAYPLVDECEIKVGNSNYKFGIVLAADGVGNAAYEHPSLERYLNTRIVEYGIKEKEDADKYKLMIFLQDLYGNEIFNDEYKPVLDYALRCFADIPADGYFAADAEHWYDKDNFQHSMPFYKRDSQSLGSRIACVGLYKTAIEWLRNKKKELSYYTLDEGKIESLAKDLREAVEAFAFGDGERSFRTRTHRTNQSGEMMFSYDDAKSPDKKNRYLLSSTVAAWFYLYDSGDAYGKRKGSVYAVSLNIGDARTYLINTKDGVRQISVDDAFPNNFMRGFVHSGLTIQTNKGYCDGSFFARIIKSELPCALFACSDGIYETVCNEQGRETLPYGNSNDPNDLLFEKNLLEAMRRSYSFDDFKRELVFTFYSQPKQVERVIESCESVGIGDVKGDDSGTAAVRFFGDGVNAPIEIFKALRGTAETSLDKLWNILIAQSKEGTPIPYSKPNVPTKEQRMDDQKKVYAKGKFKGVILKELGAIYPQAYDSMVSASADTVWGILQSGKWGNPQWEMDTGKNRTIILDVALKDWGEIARLGGIPKEWATTDLYKHVIFNEEISAILKGIGFEQAYDELTSEPPLTDDDLLIRLYDWFENALFGKTPDNAGTRDCDSYNRNYIWRAGDALRTPEKWEETLKKIRSEFTEEQRKQSGAKEEQKGEEQIKQDSATGAGKDNLDKTKAALETDSKPDSSGNEAKQTIPNVDSGDGNN